MQRWSRWCLAAAVGDGDNRYTGRCLALLASGRSVGRESHSAARRSDHECSRQSLRPLCCCAAVLLPCCPAALLPCRLAHGGESSCLPGFQGAARPAVTGPHGLQARVRVRTQGERRTVEAVTMAFWGLQGCIRPPNQLTLQVCKVLPFWAAGGGQRSSPPCITAAPQHRSARCETANSTPPRPATSMVPRFFLAHAHPTMPV